MKRSEFDPSVADFSTPMRQSYAAIALIAYRLYKILLRQLFPFLLIFVFGGRGERKGDTILYAVILLAIVGGIYSIVSFFKYRFHLKDRKLIVHKGVFKKTKLEIPFDRIQSINFEQNLLHRLFNVVKLNMDTAGSTGSELQLNALDQNLATAISDHILKEKTPITSIDIEGTATPAYSRMEKKVIFQLSIPQLLKVGVTENHLRSGGLIIFFFFWIFDNLREAGTDMETWVEDRMPSAEVLAQSLMLVAALVIVFFIIAFLISLIRTVLKYYNLKMFRIGDGFVIESGLLNRREHAAKDKKIQLMTWSQNLLQSFASIYELRMKQASSVAVNDRKSIQVAGLSARDVEDTKNYLFKGTKHEIDTAQLYGVDKYYRYKKFFYRTLFFGVALAGSWQAEKMTPTVCLVIAYVISLVGAHLSYKKKRYGITDNMLVLTGGTYGRNMTLLLLHKIQNVTQRQTPFQRRRRLSSLVLHTASGAVSIPDINTESSVAIQDYLLYRVEDSVEGWM